jgi:MYXO-CTERM domain-containing protein
LLPASDGLSRATLRLTREQAAYVVVTATPGTAEPDEVFGYQYRVTVIPEDGGDVGADGGCAADPATPWAWLVVAWALARRRQMPVLG